MIDKGEKSACGTGNSLATKLSPLTSKAFKGYEQIYRSVILDPKNEFTTFGRSVHLAISNGEMLQQRLRLLRNKASDTL